MEKHERSLASHEGGPIPKDLFEILGCPICQAGLRYAKDQKSLFCVKCGQKYPIIDEKPVLLIKKV